MTGKLRGNIETHTIFPVPKMNVDTPKMDQKKQKKKRLKDKPREENRVSYAIREA